MRATAPLHGHPSRPPLASPPPLASRHHTPQGHRPTHHLPRRPRPRTLLVNARAPATPHFRHCLQPVATKLPRACKAATSTKHTHRTAALGSQPLDGQAPSLRRTPRGLARAARQHLQRARAPRTAPGARGAAGAPRPRRERPARAPRARRWFSFTFGAGACYDLRGPLHAHPPPSHANTTARNPTRDRTARTAPPVRRAALT